MEQALHDFCAETGDNLKVFDQTLLDLERIVRQSNHEAVQVLFRMMHTIKGSSSFLQRPLITRLAHAAENLLNEVRQRNVFLDSSQISVLLGASECLGWLVADEADDADVEVLVDKIEAERLQVLGEQTLRQVRKRLSDGSSITVRLEDFIGAQKEYGNNLTVYRVPLHINARSPWASHTPDELIMVLSELGHIMSIAWNEPTLDANSLECNMNGVLFLSSLRPVEELSDLLHVNSNDVEILTFASLQSKRKTDIAEERRSGGSSIRVDIRRLDSLMQLAGELVLARNSLLNAVGHRKAQAIEIATQKIDVITSDLQNVIMSSRMQSLSDIFGQMERLTRTLCEKLGKRAQLSTEGREVELDRKIIDAIQAPLTHILRNALDHGIEPAEERQRAGKSQDGHLTLKAYHLAGQVIIEVKDDGRGINRDRVKRKALDLGLVSLAQLSTMTDQQILHLVTAPGLSTHDKATDISGRGVGVDVVNTEVSRVGGSLEIDTEWGHGTVFRMKLPLTLAIIPSVLVECADNHYAIPQANLGELVRVNARDVERRCRKVGKSPFLSLRGSLLPLHHLRELIGIPCDTDWLNSGQNLYVLVLRNSQKKAIGLVVDNLLDSAEIVVRPLGRHLQALGTYAGATILGDGSLALIIDMGFLGRYMADCMNDDSFAAVHTTEDLREDLICRLFGDQLTAIPMQRVRRIDRLNLNAVCQVGEVRGYQASSGPVRLVDLASVLELGQTGRTSRQAHALVFATSQGEIGLQVDEVLDTICHAQKLSRAPFAQKGIVGSIRYQDQFVFVPDLDTILASTVEDEAMTDVAPAPPTIEDVVANTGYVTARVGDFLVGFMLLDVVEIVYCESFLNIPKAHSWIRGIMNIRGDVITVIDIRSLLGLERRQKRMRQSVILINDGCQIVGLLVDEIEDFVPCKSCRQTTRPPQVDDRIGPYLDHLIEAEETVVAILNHVTICNEVSQFTERGRSSL